MPAKPQVILTTAAPAPRPQLSQALKYNGMVYCSGNIGMDPKTSKIVEGTVKDRTVSLRHCSNFCPHHPGMRTYKLMSRVQRQTLTNMKAVLEEAGTSMQNILKVNVFITTMDNFAAVNEVYDEFITGDAKPVRLSPSSRRLYFFSFRSNFTSAGLVSR